MSWVKCPPRPPAIFTRASQPASSIGPPIGRVQRTPRLQRQRGQDRYRQYVGPVRRAVLRPRAPSMPFSPTSATATRVCWSQAREGTTRELRSGSGSDSEVPSGVFDCLRSGPKHALPPVYRPTSGEADYLWPNWPWRQSFAAFDAGEHAVNFLDAANSFDAASHARQRTKRVRRGVLKLTVKEGGKE